MPLINLAKTSVAHLPNTAAVHWQPSAHLTGAPAGAWRSWLQEKGSLTLRLKSHAKQSFRVRVLSEAVLCPHNNELSLLGCIKQRAWVRQVLLEVDDEPWVFARSVLPLDSQGILQRRLTQVGNNALGHILFNNPLIKREALVFCAPNQLSVPSLWGRASCFSDQHLRLLVAEHFLHPMARQLLLSGVPKL